MWNGGYGGKSWGKNLMGSMEERLCGRGLDQFDIFYSEGYDGVRGVEERMEGLIDIVKEGKGLYVGI